MNKPAAVRLLTLVFSLSLLVGCNFAASPPPTATFVTSQWSDSSEPNSQSTSTEPASSKNAPSSANNPNAFIASSGEAAEFCFSDIPAYSGQPYVAVHDNIPYFDLDSLVPSSFETYSPRDSLNRCGPAYACIGLDTMPTEERGSIGQVKPSGWHTVKYDCVDGKYLYNRCHLIGYQLTGENANEDNLITGTRYLNMEGMLPFENLVADYVKETENHVAYRVTPIFQGDNLLASGVLMEGYSIEDTGAGICYCIYAYNVQPGIAVDYATGESQLATLPSTADPSSSTASSEQQPAQQRNYILNVNSKKFHIPSCSSVDQMASSNKQDYFGSRDDLIDQGYTPCRRCNP